ncbi:TetR-like C-terminal domain-containing protein [Labedella endophytica]|uniref:HTH-type transcriptional regulator MT1864/Rv1816-like C-terminal domain-containing protein n=1 Tax=Labedella endophytica TaxID=1523160 RepID=A0A3S0X0H0_9MICO|nr:TetR-like C-terminal domain-containing protein [Labedella endophytica]RUR03013.1 hypothetical protein ELQ94_00120 [Labedella endophytica]
MSPSVAIRTFRSSLHGFVLYETAGAFQWGADVDRSFDRLVRGFVGSLDRWAEDAAPRDDSAGKGRETHR